MANTDYIDLSDLENTLTPTISDAFALDDMARAISSASRNVDTICRRRFWGDDDVTDRLYTARLGTDVLYIDDLTNAQPITVTVADVELEEGTDYLLEPLNAPADGRPYEQIRWLIEPIADPGAVKVTGLFGWETVPDNVKVATSILAGKVLIRMRQAPLGFATLGVEGVTAIRITSGDPTVDGLLEGFIRARLVKTLDLS